MTAAEREERIRKHLEEEVWPTEDEMREFIRKVDENPVTYEDLMADLEKIRLQTLRELAQQQNGAAPNMKISSNGVHGWKIVAAIDVRKYIQNSIESITNPTRRFTVHQATVNAFTEITQDPLMVGGPRYRYHSLGLLNYIYTSEYFIMHYAVDEQRHLIYLRKFILFEN